MYCNGQEQVGFFQPGEYVRRVSQGYCTPYEWNAWCWLCNQLSGNRAQFLSEKSIFGTVTLRVPLQYVECVKAIMLDLGIELLSEYAYYDVKTNIVLTVDLAYKSNEIGVINQPI